LFQFILELAVGKVRRAPLNAVVELAGARRSTGLEA
jgi:hypothetical protein